MLIARFGPTTAWVGRQITYEAGTFVLEGHGAIAAAGIMEYDRQGHLLWVNAGTRAWVGSRAQSPAGSVATAASVTPGTSEARGTTKAADGQPTRARTYAKRALLAVIVVLAIANVVLLLVLAGVFRGL